jgi:hypothetical protein
MHPITRWLLALAAVAGLAAAALSAVDLHRQREALRADVEAADLGDRWPHLADAVLRDVDPYWGRINLARALVYDAADSRRMEGMTVRQAALESVAAPRRLSLARELASEALAERPVVWQSWLFRGAALYRDWFRRLDERLFTERDQWEQDLDMAIRLAPGRAEPTRVRAGIIVDLWPAMSADERALELPTLAAAFENTATLKQFVVGWLTAAEEPFAAIPDDPDALAVVRDATRRLQDWSRYRQALDAWTTSRLSASTAFLDRAEWLADHGESRMVRRDLVQYIHQSPPGSTWAPAVSRALDIMPRGLANRRSTGAFSRWLGYGLESAVRGQPLVPPEALRGLAAGIEDLNDPERALAAVHGGVGFPAARHRASSNGARWSSSLVAWASSPTAPWRSQGRHQQRNGGVGFQPAQRRPHSGQDAHCTMKKPGQQARCPLHRDKEWWRGLPARAGAASQWARCPLHHEGARASGRMPPAPRQRMVAWVSSPRAAMASTVGKIPTAP